MPTSTLSQNLKAIKQIAEDLLNEAEDNDLLVEEARKIGRKRKSTTRSELDFWAGLIYIEHEVARIKSRLHNVEKSFQGASVLHVKILNQRHRKAGQEKSAAQKQK